MSLNTKPIHQEIATIALVVNDYDEAIEFYTQKLNFTLVEDTHLSDSKRWVVVKPQNAQGTSLLLAKATGDQQLSAVGNQAGGRVMLFLNTNDFWRDYDYMCANGVKFLEQPREESYGNVAVFEDLYGNKWDLLERF
ncbi:VOC family protein [Thalassotalea euphylliae]|uniref:VOC family protein n=1 Tax=Thalassotalea euphylliae TaxID=1655234 RepID=A0A3E0TMK6_9GAMM|nr:VOC family protein [Thalassotalea euphylliae]REL25784.1 VOC family protein [Thalassotalea euphylliae]